MIENSKITNLRKSMEMSASFTVGLVNINNSFSGQNYLPYSVGLLQAYAEQYLTEPSRFRFFPFRENFSWLNLQEESDLSLSDMLFQLGSSLPPQLPFWNLFASPCPGE